MKEIFTCFYHSKLILFINHILSFIKIFSHFYSTIQLLLILHYVKQHLIKFVSNLLIVANN